MRLVVHSYCYKRTVNELTLPEITDYLEDSFEIDVEGEIIDVVTGQSFPSEE